MSLPYASSGKRYIQRTRTLCDIYVCIYLFSHDGRGKSFVVFAHAAHLLLPIVKLWVILVKSMGCCGFLATFLVMLKPQSKFLSLGLCKLLVTQGESYIVKRKWMLPSETLGCCQYSVILNMFPVSWLPSVVNFPTNSLPAVHIELANSQPS